MSIMNTYTGRKFDPMHIKPENICLEDIAHALSYLCRGGGQTLIFYPVAQHCLNCAREAQSRGWSDRMVLACLLHDASEAYISDIIRPVKAHLSNYLEIEEMIMNVIWEKFNLNNLTSEEHAMWKQIDNDILSAELPVLFPGEKIIILCRFSLCRTLANTLSGIQKHSSLLPHISWGYNKIRSDTYHLPLPDTKNRTA